MFKRKIFWIYLTIYCLQTGTKTALGSENMNNCGFTINKPISRNADQSINITIDTKLKDGISQLTELLKSEFASMQRKLVTQEEKMNDMQRKLAQQDEKFTHLFGVIETQNEKLNHLSQNLIHQKTEVENMKTELQTQTQKYQEYIKTQLNSVCDRGFLEQNQKLINHITTNKLYQEKFIEKTLKEAVSQPSKANPNQWDSNFNCINSCGPIMDLASSCEEAMPSNFEKDGVHLMKIENSGLKPFFGYCKRIDNKVWTVIQRREDGSVDFYRNWTDYKNGFGNLYGEFWFGLERLHEMTKQHRYELHIWLMDQNGKEAYAYYNKFLIGSEAEKYKLTVGEYRGNASDELTRTKGIGGDHNGMKFSTYDNCNDNHTNGSLCCAVSYKGAWWFNRCYRSHLNGLYSPTTDSGIDWNDFGKKIKYTEMAIRRI